MFALPVNAVEFSVALTVKFPTMKAFTTETAEALIMVFPTNAEVEFTVVFVREFPK